MSLKFDIYKMLLFELFIIIFKLYFKYRDIFDTIIYKSHIKNKYGRIMLQEFTL